MHYVDDVPSGCDIRVSGFPVGFSLNGKYKTQMKRMGWFSRVFKRRGVKLYHGREAFTCVADGCAGKTLRFDGEGWVISKDSWEPLVRCNSYAVRPEEIGGCNWKHVGDGAVVGATSTAFTTCGQIPVPEVTEVTEEVARSNLKVGR